MLKNVDGFDVSSISEKSPIEYIVEVGLEYPDVGLEYLNYMYYTMFPLAPEKRAIPYDMQSDYCKKWKTNME